MKKESGQAAVAFVVDIEAGAVETAKRFPKRGGGAERGWGAENRYGRRVQKIRETRRASPIASLCGRKGRGEGDFYDCGLLPGCKDAIQRVQRPAPRQGQSNALRRCSSRYGRGDGGKKGEVSISPVPDRKQNLADWKDVPRKGKGNVSADTDDSAGHGKGHGGTVAA